MAAERETGVRYSSGEADQRSAARRGASDGCDGGGEANRRGGSGLHRPTLQLQTIRGLLSHTRDSRSRVDGLGPRNSRKGGTARRQRRTKPVVAWPASEETVFGAARCAGGRKCARALHSGSTR